MKKLMMAVAIVCAAVYAQAGSVAWKSSYLNVYGESGETADVVDGARVYLMSAGTTTQAAFLQAIVNGGADALTSTFNAQVASAVNSADQSETQISNGATGTQDGKAIKWDDSNASESFYMVMLDSDNSAVYVSELISQSIKTVGATTFDYTHDGAYAGNVFEAKDGFSAGGYYTVEAVPEPFSGALALLGMGVVALRRKMKKAKKA